MECPHCGYQHGWDGKTLSNLEGEKGRFFELPIDMKRSMAFSSDEQKQLYACPSCGAERTAHRRPTRSPLPER